MRARRFAIALIVAVCVGGPIAEMFDRWEYTAHEAKETEADAVIVAVCIGLGLTLAGAVVQRVRALASQSQRISFIESLGRTDRLRSIDPLNPSISPPVALRI